MMKRFPLLAAALSLLISCGGQAGPAFDAAAHVDEILEWRAGRLERLKAPTGYLNQVGLFWLEEGAHSFGSAPDNDVVFPGSGAPRIGVFDVGEDGIHMTVEAGVLRVELDAVGEDADRLPISAEVGRAPAVPDDGVGVARGYLNRPGETERAFLKDPFQKDYHLEKIRHDPGSGRCHSADHIAGGGF